MGGIMNNIYEIQELFKPSFSQRLLRKEPKENAIVEVNNLLAKKPIKEVKLEEIEAISEKYKVDLHSRFNGLLNSMYYGYLKHCLLDNCISDNELDDLNHLRSLLLLTDSEVEEHHNMLVNEIYKTNIDEVISDGKIDKTEEEFLEKLKTNLKLPADIAEKISGESRKKFVLSRYENMTVDRQISPDDWEEFNLIAKNLDVKVKFDETTQEQIEKFKLFWFIENGELPIKEVSINLQFNEHCYITANADWFEKRTITKRINYSNPYLRIKIMKGLYYRAGSLAYEKVSSDQVQLIDSGKAYITNKRIIFIGNKKNMNIQLNKIFSLNPYSDGVGIEKDSGRSPIIKVYQDADIFTMTLGRVINDLHFT